MDQYDKHIEYILINTWQAPANVALCSFVAEHALWTHLAGPALRPFLAVRDAVLTRLSFVSLDGTNTMSFN